MQLPLTTTTRHLAILLLDHFMEKHSIMDYRLRLVALTCLLVAAKMEDRDDHLPSISHLRSLAKLDHLKEYSRDNFQRMELYLMKLVQHKLCNINSGTVKHQTLLGPRKSVLISFQEHIISH